MGAIRLFLALVVVFDHSRLFLLQPLGAEVSVTFALGMNAGFAVMFFYVISGFLISFTLSRNYSPDAVGTLAFYRGRAIRIFSLYWPLAAIVLAILPGAAATFMASGRVDKFTGLFLFGIDWNTAFGTYPQTNSIAVIQGLNQAWTLGAELTFYVLAPFLLRSGWATAVALTASTLVRAFFVWRYGFSATWTYFFLPSTLVFFLLGHLARVAGDRLAPLRSTPSFVTLLAAAIVLLLFPDYVAWDTPRFWTAVVTFAAALPGLFARTKDSPILNRLGDLSFPVYLCQSIVFLGMLQLGAPAPLLKIGGPYGLMGAGLTAALVLGIVAHWLIERPVAALARSVMAPARLRVATPAVTP